MFLFKKLTKTTIVNAAQDRVALRIVTAVTRLQRRWADYLARVFVQLPLRRKKIIVIAFIGISSGYSSYVIIESFVVRQNTSFSFGSIHRPEYVIQDSRNENFITQKEYDKIENFKVYIDSLRQSPTGKIIADSILYNHPLLMDSIHQLEILYDQQNKFHHLK